MRSFKLRTYQRVDMVDLVGHLIAHPHVGLLYCTAAGKTPMMCCAAAILLAFGHVTRVVLCAPTNVIKEGLNLNGFDDFDCHMGGVPLPRVRDATDGQRLKNYLTSGGPNILKATHQLVHQQLGDFRRWEEQNPRFAEGCLLIIDEAHRAAELRILGEVRDLWIRCGGKVLSATATPKRDDKLIVLPEGLPCVERPMSQHMSEGEYDENGVFTPWAPEVIESKVLPVLGSGTTDDKDLYAPVDYAEVAKSILEDMQADSIDCLPIKGVVRLKSQGKSLDEPEKTGSFKNLVALQTLAKTFDEAGLRVFVASSTHESNKVIAGYNLKVIEAMRQARPGVVGDGGLTELRDYEKWASEQPEGFRASLVDVVIGIHELTEGFDWPFCSHAYLLGIPRGLVPLVQVNGRCMRRRYRIVGYPAKWARTSKLVMVTAGVKRGEIDQAHAAQMLAVCAYLSTFQAFDVLAALRDVFKGFKFPTPEEEQQARNRINKFINVPQEKAARILEFYKTALDNFEATDANGRRFIDSYMQLKFCHRVAITMMQIEADAPNAKEFTRREVSQVLLPNTPKVKDLLTARVLKNAKEGQDIDTAVRNGVDQMVEDLLNDRVDAAPGPAEAQLHEMTKVIRLSGQDIREIGAQVISLHTQSTKAAPTSSRETLVDRISSQFRGRL